MEPLSQQAVSEAGKAFLKQAAKSLADAGNEVAAASCSTAQQISALEGELRSAIAAWRHAEDISGELEAAFAISLRLPWVSCQDV